MFSPYPLRDDGMLAESVSTGYVPARQKFDARSTGDEQPSYEEVPHRRACSRGTDIVKMADLTLTFSSLNDPCQVRGIRGGVDGRRMSLTGETPCRT